MDLLKGGVISCMFLLTANLAQAGDESGIYIGGSVGSANVDYQEKASGIDFDDDDTG
jgi:hypothetical protein